MDRTLVVKIPLRDSDPFDIIAEIDRNNVDLVQFVQNRFEDVYLFVETGDKVS